MRMQSRKVSTPKASLAILSAYGHRLQVRTTQRRLTTDKPSHRGCHLLYQLRLVLELRDPASPSTFCRITLGFISRAVWLCHPMKDICSLPYDHRKMFLIAQGRKYNIFETSFQEYFRSRPVKVSLMARSVSFGIPPHHCKQIRPMAFGPSLHLRFRSSDETKNLKAVCRFSILLNISHMLKLVQA